MLKLSQVRIIISFRKKLTETKCPECAMAQFLRMISTQFKPLHVFRVTQIILY
jgi:hypothetical protein